MHDSVDGFFYASVDFQLKICYEIKGYFTYLEDDQWLVKALNPESALSL